MRYVTLAVDFDGTLAHDGRVAAETEAALARLRNSGRSLVLVSGRQLDDLHAICPQLPLFDLVVAENGGLLYWPATREQRLLAEPPPPALVDGLARRGVDSIAVGRVVIGIWRPFEAVALDLIQELGLAHQVIFNKGAVMILPPSVDKGSGLHAALDALGVSRHNVVAVGDAENDHAMFAFAGCAAAVANALPMVKQHADFVTAGDHGAGVVEIIDGLVANDLADLAGELPRQAVAIGTTTEGGELTLGLRGSTVLIAGPSGSGKSTAMLGVLERLSTAGYQYCAIDPEGDYVETPFGVPIGSAEQPPAVDDVVKLLKRPGNDVIACLLGVPLVDRPSYFAALHVLLTELRLRTGRPHWLAIDEAHHLLPAWGSVTRSLPAIAFADTILVTVDPAHLAADVLARVDLLIVTGERPEETLHGFCAALGEPPPRVPEERGARDALVWQRAEARPPIFASLTLPTREIRRHRRKYAWGEIDPEHRFVFTGPAGRLERAASNLISFVELAAAVDDDVWLYHLRRGDFTRWFRETIKDDELVVESRRAEAIAAAGIAESRAIIRRAIEQRYTQGP